MPATPFLAVCFPNMKHSYEREAYYALDGSDFRVTFDENILYRTLTVGCVVCGILEIYGTTNHLVKIYFIVGEMFLAIGNFMYLLQKN